jgi:hypothetical protein
MVRGIFWSSALIAVAVLALLSVVSTAAAQEPTVRLEVPSTDERVGDAPFPITVVVEDVVNLGAFEFKLAFDPAVLSFADVVEGPFLSSSGRLVECLDPSIEPASVLFRCVTLGPEPPGADGSGTLAIVTFELVAPGTSPLRFEVLTLAQPDAERIPAASEDGLIAFGAGGVVVTPMPVETPTTAPAETTPTATAADLTPTEAASVEGSDEDDGTNWVLWGSLIGAVAVLAVAAAGVAWWSRARRPG